MDIESIRYFVKKEELVSDVQVVACQDMDHLVKIRDEHSLCLFVIKNDALKLLRTFTDIIVDRKNKHPKRSLSQYLLGKEKIPILRGDFDSPAQVRRSIRDLLNNAIEGDDRNIYFLGVTSEIFNILKAQVNTLSESNLGEFKKDKKSLDLNKHFKDQTDPLEKLFLGNSEHAQNIRSFIRCAADSDDEVLILGETGTGKEVIAKAIHLLRCGNLEKMQVINCAAISENLLESELFGYKKGAFTGADQDRKGLWELSQDGTLFLDEIGDLSPYHQAKILRALSEKKIRPVGDSRQVDVNARIIAATNVDLVSKVKSGEFRDDLYYRLHTFPIFVPPLRDRKEDITILAAAFWNNITATHVPALGDDVQEELKHRDWPGNVRVLHSFLRCLRTLNHETLSQGKPVSIKDIHFAFAYHGQQNYTPQSGVSSEDVRLHPAHCLRRLKRVSDIFFSIRLDINALLESRDGTAVHQDSILNNIRELHMLCYPKDDIKDAALFHSVPTLNEVCGFAKELKKTEDYLLSAPNDHMASWLNLAERLSRVMEIVFEEIRRITS